MEHPGFVTFICADSERWRWSVAAPCGCQAPYGVAPLDRRGAKRLRGRHAPLHAAAGHRALVGLNRARGMLRYCCAVQCAVRPQHSLHGMHGRGLESQAARTTAMERRRFISPIASRALATPICAARAPRPIGSPLALAAQRRAGMKRRG